VDVQVLRNAALYVCMGGEVILINEAPAFTEVYGVLYDK
jgi:hypothetical protein